MWSPLETVETCAKQRRQFLESDEKADFPGKLLNLPLLLLYVRLEGVKMHERRTLENNLRKLSDVL